MSIRIIVLYLLVAGLSVYAWKDWFMSLCGLIIMMAFMNRGDMPRGIFGIQGLSVWNALFLVVCAAWAASRGREGLQWDMPRHISLLLWLSLGVIIVGFVRAAFDRSYLGPYSLRDLISEELINSIKWFLPALLLFDGCRTRRRVIMAAVCIIVMYLLISGLVMRRMPIGALVSYDVGARARLKLTRSVGYCAVDISAFLAGAFWATMALLQLVRTRVHQIAILGAGAIIFLGQALTGGRGGFVAWGTTGLLMCLLKWRKQLAIAPVLLLVLPTLLPGPTERVLQGFGQTDVAGGSTVDEEEIGSGRLLIWPYVIDQIERSPLIGHGRLAMKRTGLYDRIEAEYPDTGAPNPHSMYLETLLDNGILGSLPIFMLWAIMAVYSGQLFRSKNRLYSAVGGAALAAILCQLVAGITGQHIYPRESMVGTYAAMFLMLRVHVEEMRVRSQTAYGSDAVWCASSDRQIPTIAAVHGG